MKNKFKNTLIVTLLLFCYGINTFATEVHYQINGIEDPVLTNIQNRLDTAQAAFGQELSSQDARLFLRQAPDNILKAMAPFGYYKPTISQEIQQVDDNWEINFNIDPGPLMKITQLQVAIEGPGKQASDFESLLANFPLKQEDTLLIANYNQAKAALIQTAQTLGYMDATLVRHVVNIDRESYTATIDLVLDTGPQYHFGSISFTQDEFHDVFLNRFIPFEAGDVYSPESLSKLQANLTQSGYFQQVAIDADFDEAEAAVVPLEITLVPTKSQAFTVGGGYGTDTGPRGVFGWELRHIGRSGHRLRTYAQASFVESAVNASYFIPGKDPLNDNYSLGATLFHLDLPNSRSNAALITAAALHNHQNWLRVLSLNLLFEQFTNAGEPKLTTMLLYPEANWQVIHADNPIFPTSGYNLDFRILGGTKSLASDVNFLQAATQAKGIYTLFNNTRGILRGALGYTLIDDINQLPTSLQFFTGGAETIRGFSFRSIGPGRVLMVGSAELQQRVFRQWYLAAFYDVGDVFDKFPTTFNRSIGLGIIRQTPIGPARLYLAQARSAPNKPYRVVFSLGPDFL